MSTIAVNKSRYAVKENNAKKVSLKERLRKASAYNLYRSMR